MTRSGIASALADQTERGLYRQRRIVQWQGANRLRIEGKDFIDFCSNDYLGLARHPEVVAAFNRGAELYGVGSTASHLICGHSQAHHALEEELAEFVGRERALLFSTGYMANLGVISALTERGQVILEDRLNHASLLDGAQMAGARVSRYAHADTEDLSAKLGRGNVALVVTDGVFSMDGDFAPLPEIVNEASSSEAWVMVDDAHGLGVVGATGRGVVEHFNLDVKQVPVLMGTLGKAFGTAGAFVAGDDDLIEFLIQKARTYIYTTACPPAIAEATRTSLRLVEEEGWRREKLSTLIKRFREGAEQLGLPLLSSSTAIQPLVLGGVGAVVEAARRLEVRGFLVTPIRPPTVPAGTARLRITLNAGHQFEDVDRLLEALAVGTVMMV